MIALKKIDEIVAEIAFRRLSDRNVEAVESEPTVDFDGRDAVRITIVIKPGTAAGLDGDALLDTLVEIMQSLEKAGEERFPLVEYATRAELADHGSP